ncbi:RNA polymerase sigma-70 factor (ECF subfamily) [Diaminobutyricimonas aerilata]|uniref:RNA polymerase sigma-70 factor (ECF subfamily) n=1 Tax=Diaminobutyricimonas aerilata TaxID=1162967 RepID=A0A2M9CND7_9MICO|nr:RNA polymerase sigma factor SigJ [Diaminobutyricimonas aerilata]PJJ73423.1 RNA polymerase sigma-70 factor (ECF subfamily) [Diaminobutyricimonas aerilata]
MPAESRDDPAAPDAAAERHALLGLCYRILGSLADAEDAVQETYARWHRLGEQERRGITARRSWLMTTASRICLDMLGTARARREHYVGQWLPEPVPQAGLWQSTTATVDPADRVTLDESVSMALLVVLESMTPAERVAFVLHDVFQYTFAEVGEIVGRSPEACRQLASSARKRVRGARRAPADAAQHAALVRSFKAAWETGEIDALLPLLDPDTVAVADGGGVGGASPRPVEGAARVAWLFADLRHRAPDLVLAETEVNGVPGLIARRDGQTVAVISLSVSNGRIDRIWGVSNPEKLRAWR